MLTPTLRPMFAADPLAAFSREVDRLFNAGAAEPNATDVRSGFTPAMNVWRNDLGLVVELDVPGFSAEAVDVRVHENVLTIEGQREIVTPDGAKALRLERAHGGFRRSLRVPFAVEQSSVEASLDAGVLRVTLPQSESAKPRRVAVSTGKGHAAIDAEQTEPQQGDDATE